MNPIYQPLKLLIMIILMLKIMKFIADIIFAIFS